MKRIRIFLASSIIDLKFDRIEIGNFFRQLNDIYIENGIYFDLVMCEDYDNGIALSGKQSEIDKLLCDSELVFFVFFNRVGEYTRHEFEIALDSFKASKKPKIVTYFKYVNSVEEATEEVKSFMSMLDTELRHYYNIYSEIDTLKLGMFMQIKLMRLDSSELTVEDGRLMHGKTPIAETKNIPMFERNESLRRLRDSLSEADAKYRSAKVAFLKSQKDDDYLAFSDAASEKEKIENELRELEKAVLSAAEKMYETTTDGTVLSEKQKQAYRHMERGEWELALAILDKNEIISELSHNQSIGDGIRDRIAVNVGELLQRIEVLRAAGLDQEKIEEILTLYNTVYEVTVKYNLDLTPIEKYASFVHDDLARPDDALKIAQKLSYLYSDPDRSVPLRNRAELVFLMGKIYTGLKQYSEAIDILSNGIKLAEELYRAEGASAAALCGGIKNIHANSLFFLSKKDEAHTYYAEAKDYFEIAYKYDPKAYKSRLAMIYDNYGNSLDQTGGDVNESYEYHAKAIRLYSELVDEDEKHKRSLSRCYHNVAIFYKWRKDYAMAEKYFLEAIRIREEIRQKNPTSVEFHLSGSYYFLGKMYDVNMHDAKKAESALNEAKKLRILLRKRSPIYTSEMSNVFNYLIEDIEDMESEQREHYRLEYVNTLLELTDANEKERRALCEEGYVVMHDLYEQGRYAKALQVFCRVVDIFIEEGAAWWYVTLSNEHVDMLRSICRSLDKPEIYEEYSRKIADIYKKGTIELKPF